jgi:hypothetical protein
MLRIVRGIKHIIVLAHLKSWENPQKQEGACTRPLLFLGLFSLSLIYYL